MAKHWSKYLQERIAELEIQVKQYGRLVLEAENNSKQNLTLFKEEHRKRQALEVELKTQRHINTELQAQSCLWKHEGKNLHAELNKM